MYPALPHGPRAEGNRQISGLSYFNANASKPSCRMPAQAEATANPHLPVLGVVPQVDIETYQLDAIRD